MATSVQNNEFKLNARLLVHVAIVFALMIWLSVFTSSLIQLHLMGGDVGILLV